MTKAAQSNVARCSSRHADEQLACEEVVLTFETVEKAKAGQRTQAEAVLVKEPMKSPRPMKTNAAPDQTGAVPFMRRCRRVA
jgi:hypothetical protein